MGVINIEKKDQKCFFWCHVKHINFSKKPAERIHKKIKKNFLKNLIKM